MKKLCFINGSPRGEKSGSSYFIKEIKRILDEKKIISEEIYIANSRKSKLYEIFMRLDEMDIIVFAFPLYVDCIPSTMMEFLNDYEEFIGNNLAADNIKKAPKVYALSNCGFIEGEQNKHALMIMENFAKKVGFNWRFGIGIGGGEMMTATKDNIPMKSKLKSKIYEVILEIKRDIESEDNIARRNIMTNMNIPKFLFVFMAHRHWLSIAKKNGVRKKKLLNNPYAE
ncbi:hypothetical protein [Clostridium arbusti]|uniref:hypothetical protein n=1 Tax=Clostridium arbusti TaxID=1137848 RepID=UPI00028A00F7|nr:hypothetical protein [Clostridium arbusti]